MKTNRRRAIRAAEKLRKICAKEVERLGALREKYDDLRHAGANAPLIGQLVDRLQQKELMASGDLVWAEQLLEQMRVENPSAPAAAPSAVAPVAAGAQKRALKLI